MKLTEAKPKVRVIGIFTPCSSCLKVVKGRRLTGIPMKFSDHLSFCHQ